MKTVKFGISHAREDSAPSAGELWARSSAASVSVSKTVRASESEAMVKRFFREVPTAGLDPAIEHKGGRKIAPNRSAVNSTKVPAEKIGNVEAGKSAVEVLHSVSVLEQ